MPPLLNLRVTNFRSLKDVKVTLGPVNVLVGPNASGKSNMLDAIRFLGDSARDDLLAALERRGGYERVRYRGSSTGGVQVAIEANVTRHSSPGAPDEYTLRFWPSRGKGAARILVRQESFKFKRTRGAGRRIEIRGSSVEVIDERQAGPEERRTLGLRQQSLGLATLPKLPDPEGGSEVERVAALFATFRVFDIDVEGARKPQRATLGRSLFDDASNLAPFLARMHREAPDSFAALEEDARELVPGLLSIQFETLGGATEGVSIALRERGLSGLTDLADASYGTIRALALLALLYDPDPPALTCVEEIDHGLHPYAFDLLVERLRLAADHTQFLIATHSPTFVNRLRPNELVVCSRGHDGASKIPAMDPQLVYEKERATGGALRLGELWFAGSLGGVPE